MLLARSSGYPCRLTNQYQASGMIPMLKHYLKEIADQEFTERNREIPKMTTQVLQEMNSRGITYSTMTLEAIANFLLDEFLARCDFLKDFVVAHPSLLLSENKKDPITFAKTAYQERSFQERDKVSSLYGSSITRIAQSLYNEDMKKQIKERLDQGMEDRIRKNNLYVEVTYREIATAKEVQSNVLLLQPNIAGFGIDLVQLYRQHLEPLLRRG
ncbi:hypothetical protein QLQ86_11210 [Halomonas sp. LR5S13]|uniref:hypothetical protein n=1 Tax=Halomonas rhizosphaerae TaxID=3043296 RepID=UPI0024A7DCFA|nr:hypothetical protein [Halomonas rhizosphaerae]MDI5921354.1 hypothetical protein [Halomonas rhizosphaerae]